MKTFAVIPGGGQSRRMGRPKLTLPLAGRPILDHVIGACRAAGIDAILVVIGPHVPQLVDIAQNAGGHPLLLREPTTDMRATVEVGLQWIEDNYRPSPDDDWLLIPADHPTLDPGVVRQLLQARASYPEQSIFIPTWQGKRGHPPLIGWQHVAGMRALPAGQGLHIYLRQQPAATREVPVDSPDVLVDLDTPDDYQQLLERWQGRS
jgi:molybdenum cofactor cytidylyltransferase